MAAVTSPPTQLAPFTNEPYTDFTQPKAAEAARAALERVRAKFGTEYDLLIAGDRRRSKGKLESLNPAKPSEIVGIHQKGSEQDARDAVEAAYAIFQPGRKSRSGSARSICCAWQTSFATASLNLTRG